VNTAIRLGISVAVLAMSVTWELPVFNPARPRKPTAAPPSADGSVEGESCDPQGLTADECIVGNVQGVRA
jgi:hypothetical protein